MSLLGEHRRTLVGAAVALLVVGCFEDPAAGTTSDAGGSETSEGTTDATDSAPATDTNADVTTASDTDPPETGGGCLGCLDAAGGCLAGNLDQACGTLAEACVACDEGSFCDAGTCAPRPACTADNCDGCCDASGDCIRLTDTSNQACGTLGEACAPCDGDFECSSGMCISTACANECDGCCDADMCLEGTDVTACGTDGVSCQACPTGTTCLGECQAASDTLWQIFIQSAMTAPVAMNGGSWDVIGNPAPDPYVRVEAAGRVEETETVANTIAPEWNEVVLIGLTTDEVTAGVTYTLMDEDATLDENMGSCTFGLELTLFGVPVEGECTDDEGNVLWTLQLIVEAAPE